MDSPCLCPSGPGLSIRVICAEEPFVCKDFAETNNILKIITDFSASVKKVRSHVVMSSAWPRPHARSPSQETGRGYEAASFLPLNPSLYMLITVSVCVCVPAAARPPAESQVVHI